MARSSRAADSCYCSAFIELTIDKPFDAGLAASVAECLKKGRPKAAFNH
jgi:hypothetical protein